jgi:hypothetical protein
VLTQTRQWRWATGHTYMDGPADAWLWGHNDRHPAGAWWWRYADCDEWLAVPGTPADPDCGELPPLEAPVSRRPPQPLLNCPPQPPPTNLREGASDD